MHYKVANVSEFSNIDINIALSKMPERQINYINKKRKNFKQSVVARILIHDLIDEYFNFNDGYNINYTDNGKPFFNGINVFISITHSGDFVACAVSERPVGIDIQLYKSVSYRLINKVCTNDEFEYIKTFGTKKFIDIWTAKEAYTKLRDIRLFESFKIPFVYNNQISIPPEYNAELYSFNTDVYSLTIIEKK